MAASFSLALFSASAAALILTGLSLCCAGRLFLFSGFFPVSGLFGGLVGSFLGFFYFFSSCGGGLLGLLHVSFRDQFDRGDVRQLQSLFDFGACRNPVLLSRKSPDFHDRIDGDIEQSVCLIIEFQRLVDEGLYVLRNLSAARGIDPADLTGADSGREHVVKFVDLLCSREDSLFRLVSICQERHIGVHGKYVHGHTPVLTDGRLLGNLLLFVPAV